MSDLVIRAETERRPFLRARLRSAVSHMPTQFCRKDYRALPAKTDAPSMLYLFVFTQFRTQNRFALLLDLL
ncbi:hypothetical protein DMY87_14560 [Rhizobium wuzhouense]|uniref:Uncharacterized protein n=1 Tax=Rhizobium wuzhouense TaxID=1986026 RepID=A0ABX5NRH8_9HYPH|nr:hypothetical protein DMY87_14560 [Rhizobium wuzhouense]